MQSAPNSLYLLAVIGGACSEMVETLDALSTSILPLYIPSATATPSCVVHLFCVVLIGV